MIRTPSQRLPDVAAGVALGAYVRSGARSVATPILLSGALLLLHVFTETTVTTLWQRVLGASLGITAIAAGWRYWRYELFHRLPLAEFALLEMYIFFGIATVTDTLRRGPEVSAEHVTLALLACLLFAACSIAATAAGNWVGRALQPTLAHILPKGLAEGSGTLLPFWVGVVALANTGTLWLLPSALRFPAYVMTDVVGLLAFVALWRGDQTQHLRRDLLIVAGVVGAAGLLSGMLEQVFRPIAVAAFLVLVRQRRFPASWLAIGLVLFTLLNPAKHVFREERGWTAFDKANVEMTRDSLVADPGVAVESWWDSIESIWLGEDSTASAMSTLDRLNYLSGVARTLDYAGTRVPFDRGERWGLIPLSFIPRFMMPDKPQMTREFNDRYNILFDLQTSWGSRRTTVHLPIIADGYWNFGWPGLVCLALFAGFYWGVVANLWRSDHWGLCWLALALFRDCVATSLYGYVGSLPSISIGVIATAWALSAASNLLPGTRRASVLARSPR